MKLTPTFLDADIAASVAIEGGFNPCDNSTGFTTQKRRKREAGTGKSIAYRATHLADLGMV
jgi:hypothetical protein